MCEKVHGKTGAANDGVPRAHRRGDATAHEVVTDYVPEAYRDEALAVMDGLETAGDAVLTGVTYGVMQGPNAASK